MMCELYCKRFKILHAIDILYAICITDPIIRIIK